jgi:hypothetical protein
MTDWSLVAQSAGLDIPAEDLRRITQPLNALQEVFRPLAQGLTPDAEPAAVFRADEESL